MKPPPIASTRKSSEIFVTMGRLSGDTSRNRTGEAPAVWRGRRE